MTRRFRQWWNDPGQELLRMETARARRFFLSWRGGVLIALQLIATWGLSWAWRYIFNRHFVFARTPSPAWMGSFINLAISPFLLFLSNAIYLYLLHHYTLRRLKFPDGDALKILPLTPLQFYLALCAFPLIWLGLNWLIEYLHHMYHFSVRLVNSWSMPPKAAASYSLLREVLRSFLIAPIMEVIRALAILLVLLRLNNPYRGYVNLLVSFFIVTFLLSLFEGLTQLVLDNRVSFLMRSIYSSSDEFLAAFYGWGRWVILIGRTCIWFGLYYCLAKVAWNSLLDEEYWTRLKSRKRAGGRHFPSRL